MRLHLARSEARFTDAGELILLPEQNRSRWNQAMIAEAVGLDWVELVQHAHLVELRRRILRDVQLSRPD